MTTLLPRIVFCLWRVGARVRASSALQVHVVATTGDLWRGQIIICTDITYSEEGHAFGLSTAAITNGAPVLWFELSHAIRGGRFEEYPAGDDPPV